MADTGITRIYQFLNNYDGDWKTDADKNKDGTLIKAEVYTFLADKFDWEDNDNERDIINKFWKSIDTNMTGKVKAGSGINNKNALDNNEVEQVEKMMKIADQISEFMNNKNCPTDKISNSTRWKNDVKDTLLEKVLDYMRNHPEQENITDEQLNNFYNLIERFETAKYYADELKTTLGNNLKDSDGKSLYKVNSDDKLTSIINNYIKKIESYDTSVTIDDILNEVEKIIEKRLKRYGKTDTNYGLIHADLRHTNILIDGDQIKDIDFDDCGFGWHLHDLAAALSLVEEKPYVPKLVNAWLDGYKKVLPFTDTDFEEIDTFIMMRRLQFTAWLASHADSDPAKEVTNWMEGTMQLAERYKRLFG